jgi:hypothetical protein
MNNLALVEPHAKRLEDAADKMDSDGIGGHPTRGHAVVLRQMASSMRADAAQGKLSHAVNDFGGVHAVARTTRYPVVTVMEAMTNPQNHILVKTAVAEAGRLGFDIDENKPINVSALNAALQGKDPERRWRLKESLYKLHLIPA